MKRFTNFSLQAPRVLVTGALFAVACDGDTVYRMAELPPGATGRTEARVFDGDGRLIDPSADSDGDGVSDGDEIAGWTITVDSNGFAVDAVGTDGDEAVEIREVTSDPRYSDTDGDGLPDGEERAVKSDPRRVDTDGDTLSDFDEARQWGTSPASVDTDGDARGGDPANPRPPLFQMFDAGELRIMDDPANPDGPKIAGPGATSPLIADTDGDGVNDYDEILSGKRSPTFADIPTLKFAPSPGSQFDLYLNVVTSEGQTDSSTYGTTRTFEELGSWRMRAANSWQVSRSDYAGIYIENTTSAGCCLTFEESETQIGVIYKTEDRLETVVSVETDLTTAFDFNNTRSEVLAAESSEEITIDSGTIRLAVDLHNPSTIPYRVENLVVGVLRYDRIKQVYVPVTEIEADDVSLSPGERMPIELARTDVETQAMLDLLEDPLSLVFKASRFSLVDQYGVDFDFRMSDVTAQSASIAIDYGDGRVDRFFVAANVEPDRGVSLGQALSSKGIDFEAVPIDRDGSAGVEGYAVTIGGIGTELHQGAAPSLDDKFPYPPDLSPGGRVVKRGWFGGVRPFGGSANAPKYEQNFFDVRVRPGDEVTLFYAEDIDRDGVPDFEEERMGSSDLTPHSDGDGLSDYWESRVGWMVETAGRVPYRVFSSPVEVDADKDGLWDDDEAGTPTTDFGTGTDPWLEDTDADGFDDLIEFEDAAYGLDPSAFNDADDLPKPVVTCTVVQLDRANPKEPRRYRIDVEATDPQSDLTFLEILYPQDEALMRFESLPTDRLASEEVLSNCAIDPSRILATARDRLGLTAATTCAWAEGSPGAEFCNGVDDDCDSFIDDGCPEGAPKDRAETGASPEYGDGGGDFRLSPCPDGGALRAVVVRHGDRVDAVQAICSRLRLEARPDDDPNSPHLRYDIVPYERTSGERLGGDGGAQSEANCADLHPNAMVSGIIGSDAVVLDRLGVRCSRYSYYWRNNNWVVVETEVGYTGVYGGGGGDPFSFGCPNGSMGYQLDVKFSHLVTSIKLRCANYLAVPFGG